MARSLLQDVDRVLASPWYRAWALVHRTDAGKIKLERAGQRRPISEDSWARCFIEAIRVALTWQPPPPEEDPPPLPLPLKRIAPQTYNKGSSGQDARYCLLAPGVTHIGPNRWLDEGGFQYDDNGLSLGGRSGNPVPGLKPADEMDGREPCDPYGPFPPWPPGSYEV